MSEPLDLSYRLLASRYLRKQAKQLAEQFEGLRKADDIEYVHRARVASRRLRAALKMFRGCFEKRLMKKWAKQIKAVTQDLGDARDKDVQIEFLCGVLGDVTDKACAPGIARLLAELEHERENLQPGVLKAVRRLEASKVLEEMQSAAKVLLADAKSEVETYGPAACEPTRPYILRGLQDLLHYEPGLDDPEDHDRHHAMRIAAKRFRYTLEIARPAYSGDLDPMIDAVKKVQTLLGDIHDCDVWQDHITAFAEDEKARVMAHFGSMGRYAHLEPGIEHLRKERHERRCQLFRELAAFWQELTRQGMWDRLVRVVQTRSGQPGAAGSSPVVSLPTEVTSPASAAPPVAEHAPTPPPPKLLAVPRKANGTPPRDPRPAILPR
jgi:CHAD domain-containing protein